MIGSNGHQEELFPACRRADLLRPLSGSFGTNPLGCHMADLKQNFPVGIPFPFSCARKVDFQGNNFSSVVHGMEYCKNNQGNQSPLNQSSEESGLALLFGIPHQLKAHFWQGNDDL